MLELQRGRSISSFLPKLGLLGWLNVDVICLEIGVDGVDGFAASTGGLFLHSTTISQ